MRRQSGLRCRELSADRLDYVERVAGGLPDLALLVCSPPVTVSEREDIYQRVWGYTMAREDRSVDVFVRKLRAKLEVVSPGWRYVHTHFGVGYRFGPEPVVEVREPDRRISLADPAHAAVP
jgi:DNA-binding winged helix-turn-helix (wHTH) protein